MEILLVGIGGFIGSILRYLVYLLKLDNTSFPIKTLIVNILGSFILALLSSLFVKNIKYSNELGLMLRVGVCGAFTTFSTFSFETMNLIKNGNYISAFIYVLTSVIFGVSAAFLGTYIIK